MQTREIRNEKHAGKEGELGHTSGVHMSKPEWTRFDVEFHSAKICGYLKLAIDRRRLSFEKVSELSGLTCKP